MAREPRSVSVWADWQELGTPLRMGLLRDEVGSGRREVISFEYDRGWLDSPHARHLDPALYLAPGRQYLPDEKPNFGVFLDSSPDRWGRVLMDRREALRAREEGRKARGLLSMDYLLGVYDGHRMGALRFRVDDGPFLDDDATYASPPWATLRELEHASLALERDDAERDPAFGKWLRMLIAPGRSLGGARPKASVLDEHQRLWIAKFPSARDTIDVGAWEGLIHRLAGRAGLSTAESRCQRFASHHHTFITRRFDRPAPGKRIHFASAMTLLQHDDGDDGASYLELAEFIMQTSSQPAQDLEQLWRRIVFYICVANTDDHLRNHGFLLSPADGWALAPAYDINPVPDGAGLALNISEHDNTRDLTLALEVAGNFRVKPKRAQEIVRDVCLVVRGWRAEAESSGLPRDEQDRMADAFTIAEASPA